MALAQEMQEMKDLFNEDVVSGSRGYERVLRAVGQALERYNLENFEMTPVGEAFSVRGKATPELQLHFTPQDIESFEAQGQARRADANGMANASSLSQVLRCLGAYLNQKRARLLKLTREAELLSLEYESSMGILMKESFSVSGMYDMWVRRYLQRAARASR
jgi:hypothetical protein